MVEMAVIFNQHFSCCGKVSNSDSCMLRAGGVLNNANMIS